MTPTASSKPYPLAAIITASGFHLLCDTDKDDDKFVDCAITAGADYIVTEDSHFNILKQIPFPRLNVLTLDEFNATLQ